MPSYLLLQVGLPLGLLLWLALLPPPSRLGLVLLAVAAATWITAAEVAGVWLAVPYWLTSVLALALVLALWISWRRKPMHVWPRGVRSWLAPALCVAVSVVGGAFILDWLEAHEPPPGENVELARPLGRGNYRVANGGNSVTLNAHFMTLDRSNARHRAYYGQSYGLDIVRLTSLGRTTSGFRPADPAKYAIFGDPVLAPCSGAVVAAQDGRPDMPVPRMDRTHMAGNHVMLACGRYHVLLGHLRRGTVAVRAGDEVRVGDRLGEVGNSGNTAEPHLHIHAQRPGTPAAPLSGRPVPMIIESRYLVRNDAL